MKWIFMCFLLCQANPKKNFLFFISLVWLLLLWIKSIKNAVKRVEIQNHWHRRTTESFCSEISGKFSFCNESQQQRRKTIGFLWFGVEQQKINERKRKHFYQFLLTHLFDVCSTNQWLIYRENKAWFLFQHFRYNFDSLTDFRLMIYIALQIIIAETIQE